MAPARNPPNVAVNATPGPIDRGVIYSNIQFFQFEAHRLITYLVLADHKMIDGSLQELVRLVVDDVVRRIPPEFRLMINTLLNHK
jgi:hypothetical protein